MNSFNPFSKLSWNSFFSAAKILGCFLLSTGFFPLPAFGDEPITLLSEPMHVGDQSQADMTNSAPDGKTFEAKFQWPHRIGFGKVYLVVTVSHMTPRDYPGFDKGFWQTEVFMNGKLVGILNKELRGKEETAKVKKIIFPIDVSTLKKGENVLLIKPGAKNGDIDDLELRSVTISRDRPRS